MKVRRISTDTEAWKVSDLKETPIVEYPEPLLTAINNGAFIGGETWQLRVGNSWISCEDSDHLVPDSQGELYPVSEANFEATYEILDSEVTEG